MQTTGYFLVNGQKIKVLARVPLKPRKDGAFCRSFKLRHSGRDGECFEDESTFLESEPAVLQSLMEGEVIRL